MVNIAYYIHKSTFHEFHLALKSEKRKGAAAAAAAAFMSNNIGYICIKTRVLQYW